VAYGIPDRLPTIMFCGLPVMVATLPTLLAVARAIRYGTGFSPRPLTIWITSGVSTRQTTSLTKKADRTPAEATTATSSPRGLRARPMAQAVTTAKAPDRSRWAATIIIPKSRTRVGPSIAATAAGIGRTPVTTTSPAPMMAAPVRSILRPGKEPIAKTT
jgi:hypothetical protein